MQKRRQSDTVTPSHILVNTVNIVNITLTTASAPAGADIELQWRPQGLGKKKSGFVKNRSPPFPHVVCGMETRFYSSPNPQNGPESEHLRPQSCPRQGRGGGVEVVRFESKSGDLRRQDYRQRTWGDHQCTHFIRRSRGRRGQTKWWIGLSRALQNHAFLCTLVLH